MIVSLRTLCISHGMIFMGGIVVGKFINQDELELYRSIHETNTSKLRRHITTAVFSIASLGTIYMIIRLSIQSSSGRKEIS